MNTQSPKLICLTPVKNEAWCLDVFLQCTSLWADYIIIADQGSSDGSREIALKYPKVILLDNNLQEMHQAKTRKLLFDEARKIKGDRIIIALDADELFTGNFKGTNDWQNIMQFEAGKVFQFHWANINKDKTNYWEPEYWSQWAFHDDGTEISSDSYIHEVRVPWPQIATPNEIYVKDFQVIHLAYVHWNRMLNKWRFYAFVSHVNEPNISTISLNRQYAYLNPSKEEKQLPIPQSFFDYYQKQGIEVLKSLNLNESFFWYDEQVLSYFNQYGIERFRYLDLWNPDWVSAMQLHYPFKAPKSIFTSLLFAYLRLTQQYRDTILVRAIDKLLKQIV